jgi:1-deoxyxylulose-5-phosphate synthase
MAKHMGIGVAEQDHVIADRLRDVAEKLGVSRASVAIAWMLTKPAITAPVIGASKPHHLDDAFKALDLKLDAELVRFLEEPYRPQPVTGLD